MLQRNELQESGVTADTSGHPVFSGEAPPAPVSRKGTVGRLPDSASVRHGKKYGARAMRAGRLKLPSLGRHLRYLECRNQQYRRELERLTPLPEDDGESLLRDAKIHAVSLHNIRIDLIHRWLRLEGDGLSVMERVSLLEAVGRAVDARNRALDKLGLDRNRTEDRWARALSRPALVAQAAVVVEPADQPAGEPECATSESGGPSNES